MKTKTTTYEPLAGENINETAKRIVAMAKKANGSVIAKFNDITLTASPGDNPKAIEKYYASESKRRHDKYVKSPEYKKRERESEAAQKLKDKRLQEALAISPAKMTLRNEDGWKKSVAANKDGYGGAVMTFAERWARLMEGRIAKGDTIEACADELSYLADNEGITGFMYGCAVSILSKVWVHGEQLRRWHNLKTQFGKEGDKANVEGGTLNPALLRIG